MIAAATSPSWKAGTLISAWDELSHREGRYPQDMNAPLTLATTASMIADPARAAILLALLDGRALAAGELAQYARVSAQSASMHLSQLRQSGFVEVAAQGRHRYYRIASAEVAHAVEALGVISSPRKAKPMGESEAIRYARTCYDHLAGILGVSLARFLEEHEFIVPLSERECAVTSNGEMFFRQWGIDVPVMRRSRRILARRCLDWTERRYHVAGALGAAIFQRILALAWIKRDGGSRIVHVTSKGQKELEKLLAAGPAANASRLAETSAWFEHSS